MGKTDFKIAVLDMYKGTPNQGMRCLKKLIHEVNVNQNQTNITYEVFEVRNENQIPDLSFDLYISSGGPGSPYDGSGMQWESMYFNWLDDLLNFNNSNGSEKKFLLSICHSFQMLAIHLKLARVVPRKSGSFGILPVHLTDDGMMDTLFSKLHNPFYAADFREWQVLQPDKLNQKSGIHVLALEKKRPHVKLERAVMAMRISPFVVGTQFHPEADPDGMLVHFSENSLKKKIISKHGVDKYTEIIHRLEHPDFLLKTYATVIPDFITGAISFPNKSKNTDLNE